MPKPDPALLDAARYPFSCAIPTRFSDLDTNLHVNNVALAGILEEARTGLHRASAFASAKAISAMVASLSIEFLGQGFYPGPLDCHAAVEQIGRTSHTMCQLITQQGRMVAFARTVIVHTRDGLPWENPAEFVEQAKNWMIRA